MVEQKIEATAKLKDVEGLITFAGEESRHSQSLGLSILEKCDEEGNYSSNEFQAKVHDVVYEIESNTRFNGRRFIPYKEYVKMGRPERMSAVLTETYEPLDDSRR